MNERPITVWRARWLALAGGAGGGLACGFLMAAVVIATTGATESFSFTATAQKKMPGILISLLLAATTGTLIGVVIPALERRLQAAGMVNTEPAKLFGFALIGMLVGMVLGALGTLALHGPQ